jgi:predicted metal-dependent peptidase
VIDLPKQTEPRYVKAKGNERERIIKMRTALVMSSPFYGILSIRMKPKEDRSFGTAATDGKFFYYNPEYIAGMPDEELVGLIGHETMHNANGHCWRRGERNHRLWNIACDYAIDQALVRAGFKVPNPLINPKWNGWSAEEIYGALMQMIEEEQRKRAEQAKQQQRSGQKNDKDKDQGSSGDGEGDDQDNEKSQSGKGQEKGEGKSQGQGGGGDDEEGEESEGSGQKPNTIESILNEAVGEGPTKGEVIDAPSETAIQDEADWKQAVVSAAKAAKACGKGSADIDIILQQVGEPRVDWKAYMRRFMQLSSRLDYSWRAPNPRYAGAGVYMPRLRSESMPPIVLGWDTSGSHIDKETQAAVGVETTEIITECKPEVAYVAYFDSKLNGEVQEFYPGDALEFRPRGGGGTNFRPVFDWIRDNGIEPACLVMVTDCIGLYPDEEPPYPVLWASTLKEERIRGRYFPPFGEFIYIDIE